MPQSSTRLKQNQAANQAAPAQAGETGASQSARAARPAACRVFRCAACRALCGIFFPANRLAANQAFDLATVEAFRDETRNRQADEGAQAVERPFGAAGR